MKRVGDQNGSAAVIAVIATLSVLLVAAAVFAVWAFGSRQDYKNNVESKIDAAVRQNTRNVQAQEAVRYAEEAKNPLKTYTGPSAYGSLHLEYPKTWSGYIVSRSSQPLDAYFNPDVVPSASDESSVFALRVQIVSSTYSQSIMQYQGLQKQGKVTVVPYALPKTPKAVGVRVDGQITAKKRGSVVLLPVRDKTLKLWIESDQFLADFNNLILPNVSFVP